MQIIVFILFLFIYCFFFLNHKISIAVLSGFRHMRIDSGNIEQNLLFNLRGWVEVITLRLPNLSIQI